MRVLIVDAYTAAHVGNGVLLKSSIEVIKKAWPNAKINILAQRPKTVRQITSIQCIEGVFVDFPIGETIANKIIWLVKNGFFIFMHVINQLTFKISPSLLTKTSSVKVALKSIEGADVVISITGEALNDSFRKQLPFFIFLYWLTVRLEKKMIIFPQSIGPLNRKWTRILVGFVLRRCTLVAARDQSSIELLHDLDVPANKITFSPDIGVIQTYINKNAARHVLRDRGITFEKELLIGVSVSSFVEEGVENVNYIDIIEKFLAELMSECSVEIILMPANMPFDDSTSNDYSTCLELYNKLSPHGEVSILEKRVHSPEEFKGMLSCLDAFISSRMHVSILSTMAGTPTITLNTQKKLHGYMTNIKQSKYALELDKISVGQLDECMVDMLNNRKNIQAELCEVKIEVCEKVNKFTEKLRLL